MTTQGFDNLDPSERCFDGNDEMSRLEYHCKRTIGQTDDELFGMDDFTTGSNDITSPSREVKRQRHEQETTFVPSGYRLNQDELAHHTCRPYHETQKKDVPRLGAYHSSFKDIEALVTKACDHFINAYLKLKEVGYRNEEIENLCGIEGPGNSGLMHCRIPSSHYPPVRPIAVLGPAGSGKSSAINSLLNQQKAAFAHDGQERGTFVVHEYRHVQPQQASRFLVEVPFLSREEIRKMVVKQFHNICSHSATDKDSDDEAGTEDETEDDTSPSIEAYQTAIGFFCDLFADRDGFRTEQTTEDYFANTDPEPESKVQDKLLRYVDEFLAGRERLVDNKETYAMDTEEDLDANIRAVARPMKRRNRDRKPCPWPIIRKVNVYQKNDLLEQGVILADLPGANDSDEIVAANTRSYLKQAGTILIFLPYKRVSKNSSLDQHLRTCIHLGKMRETRLVLTMIDDMKPMDPSARGELSAADQARLQKAEDSVEELEREIEAIAQAKEQAGDVDYRDLDLSQRKKEQQLSAARTEVKQISIQIQCEDITKDLAGKFRSLTGSKNEPDLPITFVSNVLYQQHAAKSKTKDIPNHLAMQTGIPQLRHEILKVPAQGKLEKLFALCRLRLPSYFSGVDGVLTRSILERKAELESVLRKQLETVCSLFRFVDSEAENAYETQVLQTIKDDEVKWKEGSEDVLAAWEKRNAATMLALFKRKGDWEHRKHGTLNCNLDIQGVCNPELTKAFEGFFDRLGGIQEDFKRNILDAIDNTKEAVSNCPAAAGQRLDSFMNHVDQLSHGMRLPLDEAFAELQEGAKHVRNRAIVDAEDSYVRRVMCQVYQQCILTNGNNHQTFARGANSLEIHVPKKGQTTPKGKGRGKGMGRRRSTHGVTVHRARIQNIRNKLRGESSETSIWQDMGALGYQDLRGSLDTWNKRLRDVMDSFRCEVLKDFGRRFQEPQVKAEESPECVQILKDAAQVSNGMIGDTMPLFQACYAYEGRTLPY